jgi:hypothetical protein
VLSLRVERAYCGESLKDGRFGMAWLRVAAELPGDSSAGATLARSLVSEPRLAGGCLAEVVARALEAALALPSVDSVLARAESGGANGTAWTAPALRSLFPGLGQRIEAELTAGRRALASGRLPQAAAAFGRAEKIDAEDPDVRAYAEEARATLALAKQIKGPARTRRNELEPSWSPSERAAADALLAEERRRRDDLLALLAVLDEDLHVPPATTLATLRKSDVTDTKSFGPKLARERARGPIEARAVYAPDGSVLSRYYFARGAELPVLREEDTSHDGKPDRWIGYRDGTRSEIWEDGRGAGRPDVHLIFAASALERIELDDDGDRRPERVFVYTRGQLTGESRDTNKDGKLDRFDRLDASGNVVLREEDTNADGSIDIRSIYSAGRLVRRELATPALAPDDT